MNNSNTSYSNFWELYCLNNFLSHIQDNDCHIYDIQDNDTKAADKTMIYSGDHLKDDATAAS